MANEINFVLDVDTARGTASIRNFADTMKNAGKTAEDTSNSGASSASQFGGALDSVKSIAAIFGNRVRRQS